MKQAIDAGYMDGSTMTYSGKTLHEMVKGARVANDDCIRPFSNAYTERGGLAILKGNLAPDGCVIKTSGVLPEMWEHAGKAKVFDNEMDCYNALNDRQDTARRLYSYQVRRPCGRPGHERNAYNNQRDARTGP